MLNLVYLLLLILTIDLKVNAEDVINSTEKVEQTQRILKGHLTLERDHRYMVAVMRLENETLFLTCGGAIIHRRYVLTAAHCVHQYRSHELVVQHGGVWEHNRYSSPQDDPRTFHPVVKTFVPRVYSSLPCRKHHHDIAILKVAQIFDLADFTRFSKVNLPEFDADYEGYLATVTGYGPDYAPLKEEQNQMQNQMQKQVQYQMQKEVQNQMQNQMQKQVQYQMQKEVQNQMQNQMQTEVRYLQYVTQMREMPVTVMSNEQCQYQANVVLTEGSLCAKALNPESQTCFEDDGGPLVHDGTIIGILNDRRCSFLVPELFTRVSAYLPFIKNVLEHQLSYDIVIL